MSRNSLLNPIVVVLAIALGIWMHSHMSEPLLSVSLEAIHFYHPYRPIFPMDPRALFSVGDQVLGEHIFAFHSRESVTSGFGSVISDVNVSDHLGEIEIRPKFPVHASDGRRVSLDEICASVRDSFSGTRHAPYRTLFVSAHCHGDRIVVKLRRMPVNMRFLFTLPDLAIFRSSSLPIEGTHPTPGTGPYSFESFSQEDRITWLRRNPYYPAQLTANSIERAAFHMYDSSSTHELAKSARPETHHLLYLYGHAVTEDDESVLKSKGYRLQAFPSEWLTYVTFPRRMNLSERAWVAELVASSRSSILSTSRGAQIAYSISPSDRAFGLTVTDAGKIGAVSHTRPKRTIAIGTYKHAYGIPAIRRTIDQLLAAMPNSRVILVEKGIDPRDTVDVMVFMLGISAADPLSHLSFLRETDPNVAEVIRPEELARVATIDNADEFISSVKQIEYAIAQARALVPLAHFPGIVAEAPGFERDESLAWSWGTQVWTYRVTGSKK